ncbi:MAG: zinc-ribbon domain-containing protein [Leptospirales bacterium]|nr:zinc-ribbon domain-containing protein [Leptospirales bacterium]
MRIVCPNCKAAHEIAYSNINGDDNSVIRCTNCGKNIKLQNCPHCNAFYSIAFSGIKSGNYTYRCKKCYNSFTLKISNDENIVQEKKIYDNQQIRPTEKSGNKITDENKVRGKPKYSGIETFSINELFKYAFEAFTVKKIIVSTMGIIFILLSLRIFNSVMNFAILPGTNSSNIITSSIMNIFPIVIIFSFYILSAAIVSKITLNHIFHSRDTGTGEIVKFTMTSGPGIFGANIILLFAVSLLLVIFGNIPLLGPVFFSLVFLPIYLLSALVLILSFIGLWFFPPIAAHDERGVFKNIKGLLLFIKRHKLSIIFMILIIFLVTVVISAVIFIIHISVFSFTTSISQVFIGQDVLMTLSSIPGQLIKASQTIFMGINSGVFKELYQSLQVSHHIAGFILGIIFLIITIFILSIPISVASTVSTYIYLLMERKNSIDDKTKAVVLFILIMLIILMILIRKMI